MTDTTTTVTTGSTGLVTVSASCCASTYTARDEASARQLHADHHRTPVVTDTITLAAELTELLRRPPTRLTVGRMTTAHLDALEAKLEQMLELPELDDDAEQQLLAIAQHVEAEQDQRELAASDDERVREGTGNSR